MGYRVSPLIQVAEDCETMTTELHGAFIAAYARGRIDVTTEQAEKSRGGQAVELIAWVGVRGFAYPERSRFALLHQP